MDNSTQHQTSEQKTRLRDYADTIAAAYAPGEDAEKTGAEFTSLGDREKEIENEVHTAEKFTVDDLESEDWEVGSAVTFGTRDGEPIHWHVIDKQGQLRMIFADDVIAHEPYNKMYIDTYWGTCSLRRWLNKDFIQESFSFQERIRITNTRVENRRNPRWESAGGPGTVDKIFVLDIEEVEKYCPTDESRKIGKWWWLRNPGSGLLSVACVYEDGTLYDYGINNNYTDGGVRPAMWVRIKQ